MVSDNKHFNHLWAAFRTYDSAARSAAAFLDHGVPGEGISLLSENVPPEYLADKDVEAVNRIEGGITTTTGADAGVGAGKGMAVGTGVGILAGLAALAIPGFGLVLGGGALATAIAGAVGASVGGAIAGAVGGYLKDQGVESKLAEGITHRISAGDVVLHVVFDTHKITQHEANALITKYEGVEIADPASIRSPESYLA